MLVSCVDSTCNHYGSCCSCPVSSYVDEVTQNWIRINGTPITTTSNTLTTPTHLKPDCKKSHSHNKMPINYTHQNYVKVNGFVICVIGDKNTTEDIRIENSGSNNFVHIH